MDGLELGGIGGKRGAPRDVKKKKKRSDENRGSATAAGHG